MTDKDLGKEGRIQTDTANLAGSNISQDSPTVRSRRRGKRIMVVPLLAVVLMGAALFGYNYFQDQARYISTDNAQVTGALVQVGSLNAGQVSSISVDIGERVSKNQIVATVAMPSAVSTTAGGTPKLGFRGTDDQQISVVSPIDGVIVARLSNPGDTVAAGQPLMTIVDPSNLWVQAQIEETKITKVQSGQPVEVHFDVLGQDLEGHVTAVDRATSGTFSLLPQGTSSGTFNKVTQLVPVKVSVDYGQLPLVLGSSASIKIKVEN